MGKRKRSVPGINGGSCADIAFMLLIFFLVTTSMDTDKGITRKLPPISQKEQKPVEVHARNVMRLLVNRNNEIVISRMVGGRNQVEPVSIDKLKDVAVRFIMNPDDDPNLPEKEVREVKGLGPRKLVTEGYAISLKNEVQTEYQTFVSVQNELLRAYNEVWEKFAQQEFHKSFADLTTEQQKIIKESAYPIHISEMSLSNLEK